jgi:hypothetical protein
MPPIGGILVDEGEFDEEVGAGVADVVEELDVLLVEVLLVDVELVELEDVDELLDVLVIGDCVVAETVVVAGGNCVVVTGGGGGGL